MLESIILLLSLYNVYGSSPNIILIVSDDVGYGDLSMNGNPSYRTPNIDSLAYDGVYFNNYYSPASVCTPARGSILTGKYFRRLGLYPGVLTPFFKGGLDQNYTTFVSILKKHHYQTAMVGKWHLGMWNGHSPLDHGFQYYFGIPMSHDQCISGLNWTGAVYDTKHGHCPIFNDNKIVQQGNVNFSLLDDTYWNATYGYMKTMKPPYFMYLTPHHAHVPQYPTNSYEVSLSALDQYVGNIRKNIHHNTVMIFTSDNGATLLYGDKGGSNGPFRCSKGSTWEGGHRVPAIIYHNLLSLGNRYNFRSKLLITGLDWYSTILAIAQISHHNINDGYNLWKHIQYDNETSSRTHFFYHSIRVAERITYPGAVMAVRDTKYKFHMFTSGGNCMNDYYDVSCRFTDYINMDPRLYDLETDPGEKFNLINQTQYLPIAYNLFSQIINHIDNFKDSPSQMLKGINRTGFPCASPGCKPYPYCCHT
jgi:arylsulfatase A